MKKHQKVNEPAAGTPLMLNERARLKELERRNSEVEKKVSFLKKPQRTSRRIPVAGKYEFIETMRLDAAEYAHSVEFMCERLNVSKSGYYE